MCALNQALSFALVLPMGAPILCLARSFSRGQRSQIARRRGIQGRKIWQLVPDGELLCFAVRRNSSTALGLAGERVGRKDWRCLGLELPGQGGGMEGFGYAVLSENHSLPSWLWWLEWLIPQRKPGLSLIQRNGSNLATSFSEYA